MVAADQLLTHIMEHIGVSLKYLKCRSLKNWDEFQAIGGLNGSIAGWSNELPDMCTSSISHMMPTHLINRKIKTGSVLQFKFMDMLMHFSVIVQTISVLDSGNGNVASDNFMSTRDYYEEIFVSAETLNNIKVTVTWVEPTLSKTEEIVKDHTALANNDNSSFVWCSYSRKLFRQLYFLHDGLFANLDGMHIRSQSVGWHGVRMVAITGVEGMGKTCSLFMALSKLISRENIAGGVISLLVSASHVSDTAGLGHSQLITTPELNTLTAFVDAIGSSIDTFTNTVADAGVTEEHDTLNLLLRALCRWCASSDLQCQHPLRLVLALDNIDDLLPYGSDADSNDDDDEDRLLMAPIEHGANKDVLTRRSVLLQQLMEAVAHPTCSATLLLIGLSRMQTAKDLRRYALTRGFETVYPLRRPSPSDFRALFRSFLLAAARADPVSTSNVSFEGIGGTVSGTGADVIDEWAARLTGLIASHGRCVAADAQELVATIFRVHRGTRELRDLDPAQVEPIAPNSGVAVGRCTSNYIKWETALECCGKFVPRRVWVQQASSTSSLSSHGSDGTAVSWSDFGGYETVKKQLQRLLRLFAPSATPMPIAIAAPRGALLYGPPGCGKTFLAGVIATEAKMGFVSVRSTELLSKWFGDTEAAIRRVFAQARDGAPSLLFFDEFDAIACKRSGGGGSGDVDAGGWRNRVLSTFLNELDGISSSGGSSGAAAASVDKDLSESKNVFLFGDHDIDCASDDDIGATEADALLVLAACQDISLIDEALLRPGRLHYHIKLGLPDLASVRDILRVKLRHVGVVTEDMESGHLLKTMFGSDVEDTAGVSSDVGAHVALLDYFARELIKNAPTPADVDSLCHRAVLLAIKESAAVGVTAKVVVRRTHLELALQELWH